MKKTIRNKIAPAGIDATYNRQFLTRTPLETANCAQIALRKKLDELETNDGAF
jgi:hypothetical protein